MKVFPVGIDEGGAVLGCPPHLLGLGDPRVPLDGGQGQVQSPGAFQQADACIQQVVDLLSSREGGGRSAVEVAHPEGGGPAAAVHGGFWLEESLQVTPRLERDGALDALEVTAGSSLLNPRYLFRGRPRCGSSPPCFLGIRLVGGRFLRGYPCREVYLLESARQFRAALKMPLVLLGGITERATMDRAMAEGFQFVAMARVLLREPDLLNRIRREPATRSLRIHCDKCMPTIFTGTHCLLA